MLLELIKDDEFMAGHDAAEAAQEWARTNFPLHLVQSYWSAGVSTQAIPIACTEMVFGQRTVPK